MRTKFKAWAEPFLNEHPEISLTNEEISELNDFYLEIGSGKGDFLINMAKNNPDKFFVGIEKNVTCSGITAKKLVEIEEKNAKLLYADAINILPLLKDESVKTLFLNFSDPWPKKRHHKRRLTSEVFLKEYQRVIIKGGRLVFKTDNLDLFNDSLEYFQNSNFTLISVTNDYQGDDKFDTETEYEVKKRKEGIPINRVIFQK
jgi:tRNA (guanine-N7-)-methyltransferase